MAELIMEEQEEQMVSSKGGKPTKKIAHFIKPILSSTDSTPNLPSTHLPQKPISLNCSFNGWRYPTQMWASWVDRLHSSYHCIWKRAGIYDAILSSKYKIVKNEDLFFGLAERWCCGTNTFVFPWGEATITLEDVAVLGGYSVLGDSVSGSVDFDDFAVTENKLLQVHQEISRGSSQKAFQGSWMKHFVGLGGDTGIEHEAFLSLWLSRFVLPTFPFDVIARRFFKIAICLARGVQIALAPVVLASIYRDLSLLKSGLVNMSHCCGQNDDGFDDLVVITLWAPLQLVQVWAWERFPEFRPKPNSVTFGEPRLARWHNVNEKEIGNVRPMLQSAGHSFEWRPYCKHVENLPVPIFCKESEETVVVGEGLGDDMKSMVRFLRVCELVGMDTIEQYNPNRVAMQFGFDQDVPKVVKRDLMSIDISKRELVQLAWLSYVNPIRDEVLYFPSKYYEPQVTLRYLNWLRQGVLTKQAALDDGFMRKRRSNKRRSRSEGLDMLSQCFTDDNIVTVPEIDVKPTCNKFFDLQSGTLANSDVASKSVEMPTEVIPQSNFYHDVDVPPGFMPMGVSNTLSVPPGFCPKPTVGTKVPDVPPGLMPMGVSNTLSVPPGFCPKPTVVANVPDVPPGFEPKSSNGGNELESGVKVKKECVESIETEQTLLWYGNQIAPAEIGFKGKGSLKIEAGKGSGKSDHVMPSLDQDSELAKGGESAQTLAHGNGGKSDGSSQQSCARSDWEDRIRKLEKMVAELSEARCKQCSSPRS